MITVLARRGDGPCRATAKKDEVAYWDLYDLTTDGLEGQTADAEAKARRILADDLSVAAAVVCPAMINGNTDTYKKIYDHQVNDWWTSLSEDEQNDIIANNPDWIGNLNGVSLAARSEANKNRLDAMKAEIDRQVK